MHFHSFGLVVCQDCYLLSVCMQPCGFLDEVRLKVWCDHPVYGSRAEKLYHDATANTTPIDCQAPPARSNGVWRAAKAIGIDVMENRFVPWALPNCIAQTLSEIIEFQSHHCSS